MLAEVEAHYQSYLDEFHRLERKRNPMEGALGFGVGPRNYPCHEKFAEDLEELLTRFEAQSPASEEVGQVLNYIYFTAPARWNSVPAVDSMLIGVHGLTLGLIPLLSPSDARPLYDAYQAAYPRRHRLPVQKKLLAELERRYQGR